ncbi:MAG: hypothetical protein E7L00_11740 [Propionibacteriaceae bacterium]|nr:hypothetical protein [Propionibacteriaceae bacterium]
MSMDKLFGASTHEPGQARRRSRLRGLVAASVAAALAVCGSISTAQATTCEPTPATSGWYTGSDDTVDFKHSAELAYEFLDERVDTYGTGDEMRLARSYKGGFFDSLPGGFVSSFLYDDALIIMAYLARGLPQDIERASALGDAFVHVQNEDPYADGRTRSSYQPDSLQAGVVEIGSSASFTGNQAWVGMALTHLYKATGEQKYLDTALRSAEWIEKNTADRVHAPYGYTGGQNADAVSFTFKATEHNIDIAAFFGQLAQVTGDAKWEERAAIASDFMKAMVSEHGHLWTGTNPDGVSMNYYPVPEDPQSWSYLTALDDGYLPALQWTVDSLHAQDGAYEGPAFSNADVSKVWFEGSGQLALALRHADRDREYTELILRSIERAQREAPNGDGKGIVAASSDGLDTGYGDLYYASLHTGATAWYLLALSGYNPFQLTQSQPADAAPSDPGTCDNGESGAGGSEQGSGTSAEDGSKPTTPEEDHSGTTEAGSNPTGKTPGLGKKEPEQQVGGGFRGPGLPASGV